eukprot:3546579-Alexandrium_andersonii.AAC.1
MLAPRPCATTPPAMGTAATAAWPQPSCWDRRAAWPRGSLVSSGSPRIARPASAGRPGCPSA